MTIEAAYNGCTVCLCQVPLTTCSAGRVQDSSSLVLAEHDLTRRMFERVDARTASSRQAGGAGGSTTYQALLAADQAWSNLRNMKVKQNSLP